MGMRSVLRGVPGVAGLLLLAGLGLVALSSGCATYGVEQGLKPYSKITNTSEYELRQSALSVLNTLGDDEFNNWNSPDVGLCMVDGTYYLISIKDGDAIENGAIRLGNETATTL